MLPVIFKNNRLESLNITNYRSHFFVLHGIQLNRCTDYIDDTHWVSTDFLMATSPNYILEAIATGSVKKINQ